MANIHPTAVVDPKAQLDQDVEVGPLCHVGPHVTIGTGTRLLSHVTVLGPTVIGRKNRIWPQATLGGEPQDRKYRGGPTQLIIGNHNEIRESVTIHRGTENDESVTKIGNNNLVMCYSHIAHDCVIHDRVTIANGVGLAGHIHIESDVNIGAETGVHHFVSMGQHCYVGGMSRLVHDVPPYMIAEGSPARVRGVNLIGLARHEFPTETIGRLKTACKRLFRNGDNGVGNITQGITELETELPDDPHIANLILAIRNSVSGIHGRYREGLRQDDRRKPPTN
ncbi:MAG: acyl-[acyl-carrier-protein]--UDP-N-acetylglucosamine O-acyltransferase [Phycisphaeraceae bacterium]|nr:acyl-[acyl-carrier-protein]--UDP-N-acetylglucosamine O-acyltransferase [Phycisphaeraceae bacterium]|tara:strand:- start:2464 stop:3303 length:840 start_codon:yes stop_codon:yes gene_type:complete